ncbi:PorP/SprF family type IX secretion system membrane protein [Larkinella arboricola]|uniref:Type IX secretion system PorP/SprF family membrane protein n=1 Tax=Larkinella arboricola TaxID=643671 RepID=A0A327WW44_LARAB|nr:type IX secretion system membrane protein PorP/SprF [Larkinella arboricola]RAJ95916.1 type IX secretion system PorP/SprF family membrane protein [Larkinella arboricola]
MIRRFTRKFGRWALFLAGMAGGSQVQAQQDHMFSQYMFNMMAMNPAYAGSRDVLSMTALYRNQWGGIEGSPQTTTFTIDMPLNRERIGLGLQLFNDRIGEYNTTGAYASYAFRIKVGSRSTLGLGIQAGASSFQADLAKVKTDQGGDPAFSQNVSKLLPNFGTGIYLSNDRSYIGVSVPQLIKNKLTDYNSGVQRATQRRHAYAMAGFVVRLSSALKLKPSTLVKYVEGSPLGIDGNLNLWIADRIAVGVSYRRNQFNSYESALDNGQVYNQDAIVGIIEVQLSDQLRLGYAYDQMLNKMQTFKLPSHEIMLRYELGFGKNKILTPRYF